MADRIIKGDSGNDVVIQNNAGSRKIEVTNSGDVEVTGDVKTTTVKATNLKANDGTAGLVVADSTGEVTSSGGVKAVNVKATNIKANDGTESLEIADSTGDIGFSANTNLKIKLPSAGGIFESNGTTEVLTESSGVAKLGALVVGSVPVGTIFQMAFTPDSTWLSTNQYLICDGSALNSTSDAQYADLYAAIGTTWGGSSASAFNIPDLKGAYLRGAGTSTAFTQDQTITLAQTIDDAFQGFQIGAVSSGSRFGAITGGAIETATSALGNSNGGAAFYNLFFQGTANMMKALNDGTNGNPRTGNETRPNSRGVQFIIKY